MPGFRLSKKSIFIHVQIECVGALSERPAVKDYVLRRNLGEMATFFCRAVGDRPYITTEERAFFDTLKPGMGKSMPGFLSDL